MLGPPGDTKKNNVPGKIPQYRKPLQNLKTYYAKKNKKKRVQLEKDSGQISKNYRPKRPQGTPTS